MKKKIISYYVILVIIGMSVTGFFTSELAQMYYKSEVEEKLINNSRLIEYHISEDISKGEHIDYNNYAKKYSEILSQTSQRGFETNTRITFIDFNGNVLGESDANFKDMENHINRKEVQLAISGKIGMDIRSSSTLRIPFLYIALPITETKNIVRISVPLLQLNKINRTIWLYTIIGIIAGLLVTVLLAFKFSSSIIKPVNELIAVSKEITNGNYSKKVTIKSKGELGELAESFNEMAAKLDKTVADIMDKNVKVDSIINSMISGIVAVDNNFRVILINSLACDMFGIKNVPGIIGINILELIRNHQINNLLRQSVEDNIPLVTEVVAHNPEYKILRVYTTPIKSKDNPHSNSGGIISINDITNLKKLEQIRTDFVSNVTHELKTPLTSIRGFVETLRGGAINDKDVAEKFLEIIDIEAERLYILINDILQLSEIESKQKDTNIGVHKLESIFDEIMPILGEIADKKGVTLTHEIDQDLSIKVNKDRIKQMLVNLVENAIKYNKDFGAVNVKAYKDHGKTVIIVKDTGIGIAKEHIPRIFERFYRVDKGRSRNMGGTGLGLSIVKHIVNLYNGDIKVQSEPGKGTEFTIQLPV